MAERTKTARKRFNIFSQTVKLTCRCFSVYKKPMINRSLKLIVCSQEPARYAKELGISVSYLSELEAGNRRINFDILEKSPKPSSPAILHLFCGEHIRAAGAKATGSPLAKKWQIMKWATGKEAKRTSRRRFLVIGINIKLRRFIPIYFPLGRKLCYSGKL